MEEVSRSASDRALEGGGGISENRRKNKSIFSPFFLLLQKRNASGNQGVWLTQRSSFSSTLDYYDRLGRQPWEANACVLNIPGLVQSALRRIR